MELPRPLGDDAGAQPIGRVHAELGPALEETVTLAFEIQPSVNSTAGITPLVAPPTAPIIGVNSSVTALPVSKFQPTKPDADPRLS